MARYTGPDTKLKKRFKLLPESPVDTGRNNRDQRARRKSVYGIRLEEKQKLRYIYGVLEKQFRRYFEQARKDQQNTALVLMQLLETRLDNVVYRLGYTSTRRAARQLVNHGHVLVNDKKIDIPSYSVRLDDIVTLKSKSLELPTVVSAMEASKETTLPSWLKRKGPVGMVQSLPSEDDVRSDIDLQLIIEYYSR